MNIWRKLLIGFVGGIVGYGFGYATAPKEVTVVKRVQPPEAPLLITPSGNGSVIEDRARGCVWVVTNTFGDAPTLIRGQHHYCDSVR